MTLEKLRKQGKTHDLRILKYERGSEDYIIVNPDACAVAPVPMKLNQIEAWLADLDEGSGDQ